MTSTTERASLKPGISLGEALAADLDGEPGLQAAIGGIAAASAEIASDVARAALDGALGKTGKVNIQGEDVEKLDEISMRRFTEHLTASGTVAVLGSEELDVPQVLGDSDEHRYIAVCDPMDGSSNIDVAVSTGSIFGVYRRGEGEPAAGASVLRPGREQAAAVYVVYGPSAVLVTATPGTVRGFTLDPADQTFRLTHPAIRIPSAWLYYSVNEGNLHRWEEPMQEAVAELRRTRSSRYVGSLVADFHRNLLKGGVFLYPGDAKNPKGKAAAGLRGCAAGLRRGAGRGQGEQRHGADPRPAAGGGPRAHPAHRRQRRRGGADRRDIASTIRSHWIYGERP